jgi:dihydrofolate reductase
VATLISIVVAADERNAIGRKGGLPWHLPNDLKRFKALTFGKPILMGRRTWDSIGHPLPGRRSIVITRQPGLVIEGVTVVDSLEKAYEAAGDVPEACVIGGADIFRLALPHADVVHLTRVHATCEADTFLPALEPGEWVEVTREHHAADDRHRFAYSFVDLRRRREA